MKQKRPCQSLLKEIKQIEPEDYPILGTSDLRRVMTEVEVMTEMEVEVMTEMEEEIRNMQELVNSLKLHLYQKLSDIQEDIYLKNKKDGLVKIREAYLDKPDETFANETYEKEFVVTKHIFQQLKNDLHTVVDTIFPGDKDFKELFAALITAYMKEEDDKYINVTPNNFLYVHFLLQSDIAQYHPTDSTKIKLTEFL